MSEEETADQDPVMQWGWKWIFLPLLIAVVAIVATTLVVSYAGFSDTVQTWTRRVVVPVSVLGYYGLNLRPVLQLHFARQAATQATHNGQATTIQGDGNVVHQNVRVGQDARPRALTDAEREELLVLRWLEDANRRGAEETGEEAVGEALDWTREQARGVLNALRGRGAIDAKRYVGQGHVIASARLNRDGYARLDALEARYEAARE